MDHALFQDWLDTVGTSFFENDFDVYQKAVLLPLTIETETSSLRVSDADALRRGFETWTQMLKSYDATEMIRTCRNVRRVDATHIKGDYGTEILAHGRRVVPPFTSTMTLENSDGWRATHVASGIDGKTWPITVPGFKRSDPTQPETTFTEGTSND